MASRAFGALLALAAAALFLTPLVTAVLPDLPTGGWFDGHPRVAGKVLEVKDVHIGLFAGTGCNTGGDGVCTSLDLARLFKTAAPIELALTAVALCLASLLSFVAWKVHDR